MTEVLRAAGVTPPSMTLLGLSGAATLFEEEPSVPVDVSDRRPVIAIHRKPGRLRCLDPSLAKKRQTCAGL